MSKNKKRILSCIAWILVTVFLSLTGEKVNLSAQSDDSNTEGPSTPNPTVGNSDRTQEGTVGAVGKKEEVIYATLDTGGAVEEIYIVNVLNVLSPGLISDYGAYSSVKNLTSLDEIRSYEDKISVTASFGIFYYQGNLISRILPWNINITYNLDSKKIPAGELAGKSGHLEVRIETAQNMEADPEFFANYLLQISVPLDTGKCSNITCTDGTIANSGADKLLTFTTLPDKAGNFSFQADVTDFTMDSIEFGALPFSLNISLPDTSELTGNLALLSDGIGQLKNGIDGLGNAFTAIENGLSEINTGSSEFKNSMVWMSNGADDLELASAEILSALTAISGSLSGASGDFGLASLTALPPALSQMSSGLEEITEGLTNIGTGFSSSYDALSTAIEAIPDSMIPEESLQKLIEANADDPALGQLIETYTAAHTIRAVFPSVSPVFDAVCSNLTSMADSLNTISSSLKEIEAQLTISSEASDITAYGNKLIDGIADLTENYESFHEGLSGLSEGASLLADSYAGIDNGISGISEGMNELNTGLGTLSAGSNELAEQTTDMPGQVQAAISRIMEDYDTSDYIPVSFVSSKNGPVTSVQFVMRSERIAYEEIPEKEPVAEEEGNFWTRLKDLFTK